MPADMFFQTADVAEEMSKAGLTMRTPNAVRTAVSEGRLFPDLVSPRGVHGWSREALWDDLQRQQRVRSLKHLLGTSVRRLPAVEPVQLRMPGGD